MNTLMNINPWSILDELFDANSRTFRNMQARVSGRFPPVNVYLDDHAVMVDVELPGRTAKDVSLSLEPQAVVIADKPAIPADGEPKSAETPAKPAQSAPAPQRTGDARPSAPSTDARPGSKARSDGNKTKADPCTDSDSGPGTGRRNERRPIRQSDRLGSSKDG